MRFINGTRQKQAGLPASNGDKIINGSYYVIDHKHLPRYIPWDLHFIRVGWVTRITDVDVKIRYPSLRSLGRSYSSIEDYLQTVLCDQSYDIDNELVSKVLLRKVPFQEFEEKKHLRSFWMDRKRQFNSHSTLKNEGPQVVSAGIPKLGIDQQKLMEDSGQKRLKLGIPVVESKRHDGQRVQDLRRASTVPSTSGASNAGINLCYDEQIKVTVPKTEDISQGCEDVVFLSDSEDDIVVQSDSKTSSKFRLQRNKKPETLEQTIHTRSDANKSDSLSDEKMQQIINELLKVGLSELDVGKAAEFCYNDLTKAKVLFGLPSHLKKSYVLGFLYPSS